VQVSDTYRDMQAGYWWPTLFPALALASLVIAVNLVADAVQSVTEG
jgi:peptide/nickel transport system permease protein